MITQDTKFLPPKTELQTRVQKYVAKLEEQASKFTITPSHEYNPTKKAMSRRDRIRAGLQKRNQRNSVVLDDLNY